MNYLLPIIPSLRFRDMLAIVQSLQVTLPLIYVIMTLILDLVNALYELKNNKPSAINISAFILLLFIMLGVYIHARKSTLLHHVGPGVWIVLFFGLFHLIQIFGFHLSSRSKIHLQSLNCLDYRLKLGSIFPLRFGS